MSADRIRQFDWWQDVEIDGLRLTATPAQHFSGRSLADSNRTLWSSWVIEDDELRVFFSGDSGYFDGFAEIGRRFGPFDLTLMETGAYDPQWPYVHMQPTETVQAHQDLRGRWLLPIHNGTFDLAMHAWDDPFQQVALAAPRGIQVTTPMMGERIDIAARTRASAGGASRMPRAPASNRAWAIRAPSAPSPRATRTATPWRSARFRPGIAGRPGCRFPRNGRSPVAPGKRPAPSRPPAAPGCRPGPS